MEVVHPGLLLCRRGGRGGRCARSRGPASRSKRAGSSDPAVPMGGGSRGSRGHAPSDRRPRSSEALLEHAARVPPHLSHESRVLDPFHDRALRCWRGCLFPTAVPIWQQTRRVLPPLFVSSAVCAAASLLQLMDLQGDEERIVRRFAVAGAAADLLAGHAVERSARLVERVGRPLHEGRSGRLLRLAKATTAAGLLVNLLPGRSRGKRAVAGILGTMGAAAVKFGIVAAGTASAGDPRATFHHQRSGLGGAEATGHPAVTAPPG